MQKKTMLSFEKNRDCPTSQELLAFKNGNAPEKEIRSLYDHIIECDFCGAEAEFYSHFPADTDDKVAVSAIPTHLFELAEAILKNKNEGNRFITKLIKENASI